MLFKFLIMVHVCAAFPLKCPVPAQWSTRASGHCPDPSKYFCLKNDLINGYSENCTIFDFLQPGRKHVLRGGLDADICSSERYQPWPITFYTNVSTNCIFLKSACNEEGQVVYDNGNRNTDITCRCDYTRGYDFIVKPRNQCFCVPSEEDCSCHLKICPKATDKLSPDYECLEGEKNLTVSECKTIISVRTNTTRDDDTKKYISDRENMSNEVINKIILTAISIGSILFFCIVFLFDELLDRYYREVYFIHQPLSNIELIEGQTARLKYKLSTKRFPVIFLKDNQFIPESTCVIKSIAGRSKKIKFSYVDPNDTGTYCLKVAGMKSNQIKMIVNHMFRRPLVNVTIMEGLDAKFEFETEETNIQVKWFDNSKELIETTDKRQINRLQGRVHTLTISNASPKDSGNYSIDIKESVHIVELIVKEMPDTIEHMSNPDREAFLKAANTGTRKRYNIRVMIVGKQSAGKTCLLRRLMNEEIDDVISTDGINIERRKCNIDIKTGIWHFTKTGRKPQVLSIDQSEEYADCAFWDFAGQKEFYATHQTFLSANAVYLLVVDISEDFKSKTYENMIEKEFDTIGEYIDFWLDNIHCYCTDDKKTAAQENLDSLLNPPVIIVGTGIDKIHRNRREERKQKFLKYLSDTMSTQPKRRHFRKPHFLSNKHPSYNKQEFEELRKDIFCKAKDLSNWEEHLPVRWVVLEKEICSIKVKKDILHTEAKGQTPARGNKKVMLYTEAQCLADECSFPNVKQETSELDSFLKYEHEIGNVIFFKEVKEFIVLDPEWLVDVFRCFVSHDYNDDTLGMTAWDVLVKTGKLEDTLIETLLRKVPCLILTKHKQYLLELMEEFCIIVKPKNDSAMNDIYMPCMIKPMPFQEIFGKINVETEYCKQSSWFCLVFNFLPPSYFNHVLVSFVKNNQLYYDKKDSRLGIYRNVGIFQLNNSGSKMLVICLSKNLIAMKVVQFNSSEDVCYSYIKTQLINLVDSIKLRYRINVNYEIKFKCQCGSLYDNGGIGYEEAMEKSEYRCTGHNEMHLSKDIYRSWLKEEEVEEERKNKGHRKCNYCKHMSVYKCYDCNKVLCRDCSRKHGNTEKYSTHLMQLISDSFILNCKLPLEDGIYGIQDIICLPDGEVVAAVYNEGIPALLVFSISGKQRHVIQLEQNLRKMDVVDKNTVAVLLIDDDVAIIDIQQNHVQYTRNSVMSYGLGLTFIYIENELYTGCVDDISVSDMSGNFKRRITLSFAPCDMCYDVDSQRIYYIDIKHSKLICIDKEGNDIFTFSNPSLPYLEGLTIDNEGNVLVLYRNEGSGYVIKVDSDGEKSKVVITNINTFASSPHICYDHLTNSVIIGKNDIVHIYKRKA